MILKLLISSLIALVFSGCANTYYNSGDDYSNDKDVKKYEAKFERDIQKIFKEIDSNKEKIRTVEEKEKRENRVTEKADSGGSESFFRKNVLQRFKNEN